MAEGEEQERSPIFTPTFLPLAAASRHTHGRVKPAPAESQLTHAGYATSAPSHGGGQEEKEEEGEEGRAATLLSPVAASASPLLLPSQPAEPPAGHGDMAPASGLSCHIRPQMSGTQSANVVPVWESGKERGGVEKIRMLQCHCGRMLTSPG